MPKIHGDYADLTDEMLDELREQLIFALEEKVETQAFVDKLHELVEVERELTLREDA